jgi:hypothetical protein
MGHWEPQGIPSINCTCARWEDKEVAAGYLYTLIRESLEVQCVSANVCRTLSSRENERELDGAGPWSRLLLWFEAWPLPRRFFDFPAILSRYLFLGYVVQFALLKNPSTSPPFCAGISGVVRPEVTVLFLHWIRLQFLNHLSNLSHIPRDPPLASVPTHIHPLT